MFWVSIIFFLSGLSALVYQLLWMRYLGFVFGNTVYASATVLTAFMGGLAIGSHLFGRIADRIKDPLRAFAILEWIVAGYALLIPFLFEWLQSFYRIAYQSISQDLFLLTPLRFTLAIIILLLPTVAMGGTLPVLIRALANTEQHFGFKLGWLYGINTLGAVAGVFLTGFYLLPEFGLSSTNILAVTTDIMAGIGAWLIASRHRSPQIDTWEVSRTRFTWSAMTKQSRYAILIATFCGFISLALEVIWFRALILVFGSTTYSFTVMLGIFLLGIGMGSLIVSPFLDRLKNLPATLAVIMVCIGAYTLWSLYRFDEGPEFLLQYLNDRNFTWKAMNQARLLIALSHLAMPAVLFGIAFTLATKIVRRNESSSSGAVGVVYALNTVGAVFGSFAGGFIMLPYLGMEGSLVVVALCSLIAGLVSMLVYVPSAGLKLAGASAAAALTSYVIVFPPAWNKSVLSAGAFFGAFNFVSDGKVVFREKVLADRLLHYRESVSSTISVHIGEDEAKYFCVDGKTEADQGTRGMVVQRMIGHLPMLFHPHPRKAMNLGLGAGVSFGALGTYPLEHLEVVEIDPEVSIAARTWGPLNHNIIDDPRAIITINDGRNHLFCTTNYYDVITSDPFEPVVGGAGHLFTVDHFENAKKRLGDGGIMCQWIPMYEMTGEDYLTIVRSFVSVFPDTALFYTGLDTLLLGFKDGMKLDPHVLRRNFEIPEVNTSLKQVGFSSPEMILGMFVADLSQHPEFAGSGPLNTDDRPVIEFSTPKSQLRYTTDENQAALLRHFTPIPDEWLKNLDPEKADRLRKEHEAVRLMLEAGVMRARGDVEGAFITLAKANETAPENPVVINEMVAMLVASAQNLRRGGDPAESAHQFQSALQLDPKDFWSIYYLVELFMQSGQVNEAKVLLEHGTTLYPDSPMLKAQMAKYLFSMGDQASAYELMKQAVMLHPKSRSLWNDLLKIATAGGDPVLMTYAQQNLSSLNAYVEGR